MHIQIFCVAVTTVRSGRNRTWCPAAIALNQPATAHRRWGRRPAADSASGEEQTGYATPQTKEEAAPAGKLKSARGGKASHGRAKAPAPPLPRQESSPIMQTASDLAPGPSPSSLRVCVNFGLQKKGGRRKEEERIGKRRVRTVLVSVFLPFYPIPGGGRGASGHGGGGSRLTSRV